MVMLRMLDFTEIFPRFLQKVGLEEHFLWLLSPVPHPLVYFI